MSVFTDQDREDITHLKKDMWFGNGQPGVTTRLAKVEGRMDKVEKNQSATVRLLVSILLLLIAALGTEIGALATRPHP